MIGVELQRALDAFPLERWAAEHGFEKAGRDERAAPCPRCGKDAKLVVNVRRRRWHCWVCQRKEPRTVYDEHGTARVRHVTVEGGGGLLKLVAWFYGCTTAEAGRWVLRVSNPGPLATAALPGLEEAAVLLADDEDDELRPPPPPAGACPLTGDNLSYLASRRLGVGVARAYGLFSCVGGPYHRRVVFPTWGARGELLYWQARATWDPSEDEGRPGGHLKAMNPSRPRDGQPPELTSEHVLGNLHRAALLGGGRIALTEGPVSGIQAGDDGTWTHGKQLTAAHITAIVRAGVRAVDVMYDGPSAKEPEGAREEQLRAAQMLLLFVPQVRTVWLPWGDPGDYDRETNARFRAAGVDAARPSGVMRL